MKGFTLKEDFELGQATEREEMLEQLSDMFGSTLSLDVIVTTYEAVDGNMDACIQALLDMQASCPHESVGTDSALDLCTRSGQEEQSSHWNRLPEDCVSYILDMISPVDMAKAARTCKRFAEYARQQRVQKASLNLPRGLSREALRGMIAAFRGCYHLDMSNLVNDRRFELEPESICSALQRGEKDRESTGRVSTSKIRSIRISNGQKFTHSHLYIICEYLRYLEKILIVKCPNIGDEACLLLSKYKRDGCTEDKSTSTSFTKGTILESPTEAVKRIADEKRKARGVSAEGTSRKGLVEVSLDTVAVSDKGILHMLKGSGRAIDLGILDISRNKKITGECLSLSPHSNLSVLKANSCPSVRIVQLHLSSQNVLEYISLSNCRNLKEVRISAPKLLHINLSGCHELESVALNAPKLQVFNASVCKRLVTFQHIDERLSLCTMSCPELMELNLFGCVRLLDDNLNALLNKTPKVRKLRVSGCIFITKIIVEVPTDDLIYLDTQGCSRLNRISLKSGALDGFNFSGCPQLTSVQVNGNWLLK